MRASAIGEARSLLRTLISEIVTAQHTVYHTAPVYEDDTRDDIDEMSAGGIVGSSGGHRAGVDEAAPTRGNSLSASVSLEAIQMQAGEMMDRAWNSDVDESHFRHKLEALIGSRGTAMPSGKSAALIDDIIREMSTCAEVNSDIRFELADNGDDEQADDVQDMRIRSDKHRRRVMALIERLFKSSNVKAK